MGPQEALRLGAVEWRDLAVPNAEQVRGFYAAVAGWVPAPVSMGEYDDYAMVPGGAQDAVAGICHARGANAQLPAQWLIYIRVADVATSVARAEALRGRRIDGPRDMGGQQFCVIQDPAGAVAALIGP